jgi:hypothetical protein
LTVDAAPDPADPAAPGAARRVPFAAARPALLAASRARSTALDPPCRGRPGAAAGAAAGALRAGLATATLDVTTDDVGVRDAALADTAVDDRPCESVDEGPDEKPGTGPGAVVSAAGGGALPPPGMAGVGQSSS